MAPNKGVPSNHPFINRHLLGSEPTVEDDGRLTVNVNPRAVKSLSLLADFPPPYTPQAPSTSDPPEYQSQADGGESWKPFHIKLNIVIQIVGSRGDVQPFVALGNELQKHGHRVRLATHNVFDSFVRDAGLEFFPIGGDPAELMAYMVRNPGLIPSVKSLREGDIQRKRQMMAEMLDGCWRSCIEPDPLSSVPFVADAIIANPPSFAHVHCAQALGIPVHIMFTMPWTSTSAFPHPLVNLKFGQDAAPEPMAANYISYFIVEFLTWQGLGHVVNQWRETLDLEHLTFSDGPCLVEKLNIPTTYCWSPALVPKPEDWGKHIDVCGFFFRDEPKYEPPENLRKFLEAGTAPMYIGFGSIVIDDPQALSDLLLEAIHKTGTRALISRGWSKLRGEESDSVMFLDDCPHEWLFQHVSAVMHHGGAGTTACGLLNGRPTNIVPFFGDQPFWGDMVAAAGAGPKPIPHKSLSIENVTEAINFCLKPETATAAAKIASKMRCESGVKAAAASFHANLPTRYMECDIIKGQPAVWTCSRRNKKIRLSKVAGEILTSHLKVDRGSLQMNQTRPIKIETRRWDPITGTIAAAMGVSADLARAASDTVVRPAKVIHGRERNVEQETVHTPAGPIPVEALIEMSKTSKNGRGCLDIAKSASTMSASGMGNFLKHFGTGIVTIPFAFTEGFRSIPLLYGDKLRDYGEIHDWKSGFMFGGKAVVFGIYDGVTGIVLLPVEGAKTEGTLGAAKGVGKGLAGLGSKVFTATIGVATYPLRGVYKSVLQAVGSHTRKSIDLARHEEGKHLVEESRARGASDKEVMEAFDAIMTHAR